jgi:hypothetical protein
MLVAACAPSSQISQAPDLNEISANNADSTSLETNVPSPKAHIAKQSDVATHTDVEVPVMANVPHASSSAHSSAPVSPVASKAAVSFENSTQSCPDQFYNVKLPTNGKFCQVFAADLPASMILFVPQEPTKVIEFYQQHGAKFSASKAVKDRFIMNSNDNSATVIFSRDGQGTQVDILVKNI